MFSYGEIFITLAAALALFGPKDIPIVARAAGKFVGKAVGYIQSARGQVDDIMKRSQVDQIHKELQETMAQLDAIRYEIRNGVSISNPGPITRSVLNVEVKSDPPGTSAAIQTEKVVAGVKNTAGFRNGTRSNFAETPNGQVSDTKVVLEMEELHRDSLRPQLENGGSETSSTSTTRLTTSLGFQPGPDGTFNTIPSSTGRIAAQRVVVKPVGIAPSAASQLPSLNSTDEIVPDITVLPISAVSAGLLPPKTGPLSGGADLVLESLTERKVAFDTLEFFQRSDQTLRKH